MMLANVYLIVFDLDRVARLVALEMEPDKLLPADKDQLET